MTAKEYLNQLIAKDNEITRKQQRLETLRDVAVNTTPDYSGEAVQRTREKNPLENIMAEIIDLDREIDKDIDELVDLKAEVWEQIDKMEDERQKRILWLKYAERKSGKFIAEDLGLTQRHIRRLHTVALNSLEKVFVKNIKCPTVSS